MAVMGNTARRPVRGGKKGRGAGAAREGYGNGASCGGGGNGDSGDGGGVAEVGFFSPHELPIYREIVRALGAILRPKPLDG